MQPALLSVRKRGAPQRADIATAYRGQLCTSASCGPYPASCAGYGSSYPLFSQSRNSPRFMEPRGSPQFSQQPTQSPFPWARLNQSTPPPHPIYLGSNLILSSICDHFQVIPLQESPPKLCMHDQTQPTGQLMIRMLNVTGFLDLRHFSGIPNIRKVKAPVITPQSQTRDKWYVISKLLFHTHMEIGPCVLFWVSNKSLLATKAN